MFLWIFFSFLFNRYNMTCFLLVHYLLNNVQYISYCTEIVSDNDLYFLCLMDVTKIIYITYAVFICVMHIKMLFHVLLWLFFVTWEVLKEWQALWLQAQIEVKKDFRQDVFAPGSLEDNLSNVKKKVWKHNHSKH